ncbi:hypothetical protein H5368_09240 [Luteimonas sp. MC1782]|uniref:hypothetical protein n=1 Tax=Luteimonas sp. MC1782 TaxID=2760305 RepID=UPI0016003F9F|nr:hypothetical protein [Luteimonas sp. MC1782]MBB1473217.1 hypothetical protein [Luteimonas sp. MC1782]
MSTLKKDHVLGAGTSAVAGGTVGAVVGGLVGGPAGAALGAIAGTAAAAVAGQKAAEALDPRGDIGHFEQIYRTMPYYISGMAWSDYAPAYRLALDSHGSDRDLIGLEAGWTHDPQGSRLLWSEVLPVIEHTWRELENSSLR